MSFRVRLYVCLIVAVMVGAAAEVVFDTLETQEQVGEATELAISDASERTAAWLVERFSTSLADFLDLAEDVPPGTGLSASHVEVRRGDELAATAGDPTAPRRRGVVRETRDIGVGYTATITVDPSPYAGILYRRLRSDLITDVGQLVLSLIAVWLLAGWLQRPVRRLTRQVDAMSGQRLPQPVPLPAGRDEFAELARAFNQMTENVQDSFSRESAFTRYASHELRTPLSAIQLQVESLRLGAVKGGAAADVLERNVQRMQRVLDALLGLTRIAHQTMEPARVGHVVDDVVGALDPSERERLRVHRRSGGGAWVASPHLVAQAIRNLLDNALKYTPGEVDVLLDSQSGMNRLVVRDRGSGVPNEVLGSLTRPYVRHGQHPGGSGLGLAFVHQVTDALGGEIHLRNLVDGFEVELVLPAMQPPELARAE